MTPVDDTAAFAVPHDGAGTRLDIFLGTTTLGLSRSHIQKLIAAHAVTVNGPLSVAKTGICLPRATASRWRRRTR